MFEVRIYGDPVLRKEAKAIEAFDESLQRFIDEMIETMREEDGVGLAAPQVGESIQLTVIDPTGGEKEPFVLINPEIIWYSEEKEDYEEGCLSIPGISLSLNRPSRVTVKALDRSGKPYVIENAEGLLARALQHEIDHLKGVLFVDHITPLQRSLINNKLKKMAKSTRDKSNPA